MRKIIEPGVPAKIEYYCDCCNKQICSENGNEFSMAIQGAFGYNSPCDGLNFGANVCGDCALKIVVAMEQLFNIKIENGFGLEDPFFNGGQ